MDALNKTDIADHALATLAQSKIKEVVVIGRRGVAQAAYNNPELEELLHTDNVAVSIEGDLAMLDNHTADQLDLDARRKLETLKQLIGRQVDNPDKRIVFRFLASPQEVSGAARVEQLKFGLNELRADNNGKLAAVPTGDSDVLDTGLVLFATAYRGLKLDGLPYDAKRGIIPHAKGRVINDSGEPTPRTYVTGWIKRGPQGVIGSNKKCALEKVDTMVADIKAASSERLLCKAIFSKLCESDSLR